MKTFIIFLCLAITISTYAQEVKNDTSQGKFKKIYLQKRTTPKDNTHTTTYTRKSMQNTPYFKAHWSGFNIGFINFCNTDYSRYANTEFMDVDWGKSLVMQFNILQQGFRLTAKNNLGLVTGLGLEYQRLQFSGKNSITVNEDGELEVLSFEHVEVKRSSFKNLYLTIPLLAELQFPAKFKHPFYLEFGFLGGFRLHSKTKVVYKNEQGEKRRLKDSGSFGTIPFKTDIIARVGYDHIGIWSSYTLTRLFKSGKGPQLHPFAMGMSLNF